MAYRPQVSAREKSGAIAAVIAIHAILLAALLNIAGKIDLPAPQSGLRVFDLEPPKHSPARRERPVARTRPRPGAAAPKNVKSRATPVVAPRPRIETPPVRQIAVSETAGAGTAPTQGATSLGPGTGAGGRGEGTGSGNGGNGSGNGGAVDIAQPPRLATAVLESRDFHRDLLEQWPPRATIFLRLRIDAHGNVAECMIDRGTGVATIDAAICNIAHDRLRFHPALDRSGQPVAGWFGYAQPAPG